MHNFWAAIDAGLAVQPRNVAAQTEGSMVYALGHVTVREDYHQERPRTGMQLHRRCGLDGRAINTEKPRSCAIMNVSFYVGNIDGTIVTKDGVWQIARVLIVGIVTHGRVQSVLPKAQWLAIAVASEGA